MYRIGDVVRPWAGENLEGAIVHVADDGDGSAVFWCRTRVGAVFAVQEEHMRKCDVTLTKDVPTSNVSQRGAA